MLPWRVETCALWQPTSHSGREELQHPRRGSACHRLVPKQGTPLPPWLQKPHARHRPQGPYKDFRRQGTKGHSRPRILNLKEKTLMFTFRIKYLKGDTNCAADALSRYPILSGGPEGSDEDDEELVCAAMTAATAAAAEDEVGNVVDLHQVEEEAAWDEEYRLLRECVANDGWAERKDWEPLALRQYFKMRRHLSCQGNIVLYTCDEKHPRLVIPAALRRAVLANLHAGHQGRDSMLRRARQSVYWPGIDAEVEQKRRQCAVCDTHAPSSPAETLLPTPPPQYPFQQVVADLFQLDGHTYIAVADRLSGWLEVEHLSGDATSACLITVFRRWFKRFGIPEELSCDGGTNLTSQESRGFLDTWRVRLRVSSAHYPQSNGRAEAAVKCAKRLLRGNTGRNGSLDTDAAAWAIMQYFNTPPQGSEASPAQLITGRQLRDAIPVEASLYEVSLRWAWLLRKRERAIARSGDSAASRHDQTAHNLEPLTPGLRTRILNPGSGRWDRAGTVLETTAPRQYLVRLDGSGRTSFRNRRHLRPLTCVQAHDDGTTAMPGATPPSQGRPQRHRQAPRHLLDYVLGNATPQATH
ncbi:hypothetical protein GWK47_022830 [Chionoecetes opilio]|uniref:RNA-directed DNA polymerase n=1 Tax=Chionoecetes opilio TaxID=41210 RepID=A0A8J4XMR5_CHIOP|nr:hypothetical protein GWK47_022830 [Chionoecetes opilio]